MPLILRLAAVAGLAFLAVPASAADFDGSYPPRPDVEAFDERPPPPPPPEPAYPPRFTAGPRFEAPPDACRTFVKRRIDIDGEEVVRRVRVCDEHPGFGDGPRFRRGHFADHFGPPLPPEDVPPRRHWEGPRW
ncbi:hypothetical protein [Methylobacterium sp. A54F]